MSPNFKLTWLTRKTLESIVCVIAPYDKNLSQFAGDITDQLEIQLRAFTPYHRWGIVIGLLFIEVGGIIGAWGLLPFSTLSRKAAIHRFEKLSRSRIPPVRLLCHALKVLICLAVYSHPKIERQFASPRRQWIQNRRLFRNELLTINSTPPLPEARTSDKQAQTYLRFHDQSEPREY